MEAVLPNDGTNRGNMQPRKTSSSDKGACHIKALIQTRNGHDQCRLNVLQRLLSWQPHKINQLNSLKLKKKN